MQVAVLGRGAHRRVEVPHVVHGVVVPFQNIQPAQLASFAHECPRHVVGRNTARTKQLQNVVAVAEDRVVYGRGGASIGSILNQELDNVEPSGANGTVDRARAETAGDILCVHPAYGTQIPGKRHLYRDGSGQIRVNPDGTPPMWKGSLDEDGRLMVVMNVTMDMGDAWEHADDPEYPQAMTALGYRVGINYIMYAMTH